MKAQERTSIPKKEKIERKYYLVDATGKPLGRLASNVAKVLFGKTKACWVPFLETGDYVIITNAEKVRLTGKKLTDKLYRRHSGYIGGLKTITAAELLQKSPETVIREAVKGMLPKNTMGRKIMKNIKIYRGADHPHAAQKPIPLDFD
ncbi:MAG: 50S ribosomal protein L13 [Candidatus Ratteibacteria bacterium]|jgi:large subunit ribosomal protein L13